MILSSSVGDSMDLHFWFWSPFQATQATCSTSGHGGNTGPAAFFATNEAPHPLLPFAPCRLETNLWQIRVWAVWMSPRGINELYIIFYVIYVLFSRIQYWSLDYGFVFWTMWPNVIGYVASGFCSRCAYHFKVFYYFHIISLWWWSFH